MHNAQSIKGQTILIRPDLPRLWTLLISSLLACDLHFLAVQDNVDGDIGDGDIGGDDVSGNDVSGDDEDDGDGVSGGGGGGGQGVWKGSPGARRYLIGFSTEKSSLGESELWSSWSWS